MGNKESNEKHKNRQDLDIASLQIEELKECPEIYKVIGLIQGGELVQLMKTAQRNKDYSKVDEYISTNCSQYLYNNGAGEMIPIETLVTHKTSKIENQKRLTNTEAGLMKTIIKPEILSKFVCADINKRGLHGENLLHLCLLHGTSMYKSLAKRFLKIYPNLINDIYVGDEYYGQSVLHMAIVNEDPSMVSYLLSCGADVHQRCIGKFFCPDDQKEKRQQSLLYEFPSYPVDTDYIGYSYFGEYPLSFAALLNQEECVRLLVANGADPDRQDSNGNTVLHMLVINNNIEMFKLMIEMNASLDIKNRQGYTPLTLAAKLCRKEIFFIILETLRTVYWIYADISCAAYPLKNVDTISDDGTIDTNSVLYIILNTSTEHHLELLDGFLFDLLHKKWTTFIKLRFYFELVIFAIFFILNAITIFLKRTYYDYLTENNCTEDSKSNNLKAACKCAYLYPVDSAHYARTIIEIIVVLYTIVYILITLNELYIQRWRLFLKTLISNPTKIFFVASLIMIMLIIPFRLACNVDVEDILVTLIIIFLSFYSIYFARGFRLVCNFVLNLHHIIGYDVVRFILIYSIFLAGFSQMFYLIMDYIDKQGDGQGVFGSPLQSIMDTFILTLGEVNYDFETVSFVSVYSIIGEIFFTIYLIIGTCLLVNMLIAMMDHTQEITNDRPNEWIRQWGRQILAVEQNINIKERLKQQKRYINELKNGEKTLIVRWHQDGEERTKVKTMKEVFQDKIRDLHNHIQG